MSLLIIGDLHFKERGVKRYSKMTQEILEYISKNSSEIDGVILLGDILHKHEQSHQVPFDMACNFILEVSKLKQVFCIIGNHDLVNNSCFLTDKHFFNPLKNLPNIEIIDTPKEFDIDFLKIGLIPYVYPGRFHEAISKLPNDISKYNAIFAHQEIYQCKMGAIRSQVGDK